MLKARRGRRVDGPWHPPGTTPLDKLALAKELLEEGVLAFPSEALTTSALVVVLEARALVRAEAGLGAVAIIAVALGTSVGLVLRWRRSRRRALEAVEAWNHYAKRAR